MRVVMVVSSKHGGTREIGRAVADVLGKYGIEIVDLDPDYAGSLPPADAVVLGSALYADGPMPALASFVEAHQTELACLPSYLFVSGPWQAMTNETPIPDSVLELAARIGSRDVRQFGGRVDSADLGAVERSVVRMRGVIDGDYRELHQVHAWAVEVAEEIGKEESA